LFAYSDFFFIFLNVLVLSNIASFIAYLKACENRPLNPLPDFETSKASHCIEIQLIVFKGFLDFAKGPFVKAS
jgi:hypothetical protein